MKRIQSLYIMAFFVIGATFLIIDTPLSLLGDISSLLFFFFALIAMIALSTAIAHQLVKQNHYQSTKKAYETSKAEIQVHIGRYSYEIHFTQEALEQHEQLLSLNGKIKTLRGDNYENNIINTNANN